MLGAALALSMTGCGHSGFPTADRVEETLTFDGNVGPGGSSCAAEIGSIGASVRVDVVPTSLFLELRRGTCTAPGTLAAASPGGRLTQNVRAGDYNVNIVNASDVPVNYSLTVRYTRLSN